MADISRIKDALSKLDPKNDNHWTGEGLPRIDTVKLLAGDQSLTREVITQAVPDFTRESAAAVPAETTESQGNSEPQAIVELAAPAAPATPDVTEDELVYEPGSIAALEAAVKAEEANLEKARATLKAAQAALEAQQAKHDAAIDALSDARGPYTSGDAIRDYLAAQRERLEERAAKQRTLSEAGLNVRDLSKLFPSKAPIDIALSRKR